MGAPGAEEEAGPWLGDKRPRVRLNILGFRVAGFWLRVLGFRVFRVQDFRVSGCAIYQTPESWNIGFG